MENVLTFYIISSAVTFAVNIPCGYIRESYAKFSGRWFLWQYAALTLIILLHINFGAAKIFIPVYFILAAMGQRIGTNAKKKRLTKNEIERLEQIPDLHVNKKYPAKIDDHDVMIVLLNMGGPATNQDIPAFLKKVFNDPLLIRFPLSKILQPLFAWALVTFRAKATQERYQLIGGGTPLYASTQAQVQELKAELARRGRHIEVTYSFNYTEPLPKQTIAEVVQKKKRYILPLSLYPHYSAATTGSNLYYLEKEASQQTKKSGIELTFLDSPSYFMHDGYIQAFVERIHAQIQIDESLDDFYIIFSAHGLPLYFLKEGDPYPFQIAQTTSLILEKLNRQQSWVISYQSAVGPMQWLKPSTEDIIKALARRGITKVLVVPIAFVTDHIETLCEIDIEYRKYAEDLGIKDFRMARAIECHPRFIGALADSVEAVLPKEKSAQAKLEPVSAFQIK